MSKDNLGDRMKSYENIERRYLTRRIPTLIRLDGKAFHSFTKGFQKPFDDVLMKSMWNTAKYLCEHIQGCKVAYTQSDEITLLLTDYETITTDAWFDKNIQKMCSISASMATLAFNNAFSLTIGKEYEKWLNNYNKNTPEVNWEIEKQFNIYLNKENTALFDSRVYNIPKEEVCNAFIWRQQDATRNAIQMVGQANFSHKELQNKNCNQIQEMLFQEKGINFNDFLISQRRGVCVIKESYMKDNTPRTKWVVDEYIPIFTQERCYIEKYL